MAVRKIILTVALISASLYVLLHALHEAGATGNAFRFTKHGAQTSGANRTQFGGVNRSVVSFLGGTWPSGGDAGSYNIGECVNCHEPHASWGTFEQYPSSASFPSALMSSAQAQGPDPHLLFSDTQRNSSASSDAASFCWTCHESLSLTGFDSGNPQGWGYYGFYQGKNIFLGIGVGNMQPHSYLTGGSYSWPGTTGDPVTIWPRQSRTAITGSQPQCLQCHTPHGIKGTSTAAFDTAAVPASAQTAAANPAVTENYLIPHQLLAWEEALCENCHDGSPAVTNIKGELDKWTTGSGHPVHDTTLAGRHWVAEAIPVTPLKHVECYDCHNPHAEYGLAGAKQTAGTADPVIGKLQGLRYVDTATGTMSYPYPRGARQPYIHEVCFKCHSGTYSTFIPDRNATGVTGTHPLRTTVAQYGCATPNPASGCTDGSNKLLEFSTATNPTDGFGGTLSGNRAYHPVTAAGRNTAVPAGNLLGGLSTTNTINCTDCHNSDVVSTVQGPTTKTHLRTTDIGTSTSALNVGPHGSTNVRILRANYNTTFGTTAAAPFGSFNSNNFALCFNCHSSTAFTDINSTLTNFRQAGGMGGMGGMGGGGCNGGAGNLHAVHLNDGGGGMMGGWNAITMFTSCANCHYNPHSNAEASNTEYGTAGGGTGLPADGDTHLVNFSPIVQPLNNAKPRWYFDGTDMRCNLICHGVSMGTGGCMGGMMGGGAVDACYTYTPS